MTGPSSSVQKARTLFPSVYADLKKMREDRTAPVDYLGVHRTSRDFAAPNVRRFHCLCGLVLSSQTRDEETSAAMLRLHQIGCNVETILEMSEEDLARLLYPVGFYRNKAKFLKRICGILATQYKLSEAEYAAMCEPPKDLDLSNPVSIAIPTEKPTRKIERVHTHLEKTPVRRVKRPPRHAHTPELHAHTPELHAHIQTANASLEFDSYDRPRRRRRRDILPDDDEASVDDLSELAYKGEERDSEVKKETRGDAERDDAGDGRETPKLAVYRALGDSFHQSPHVDKVEEGEEKTGSAREQGGKVGLKQGKVGLKEGKVGLKQGKIVSEQVMPEMREVILPYQYLTSQFDIPRTFQQIIDLPGIGPKMESATDFDGSRQRPPRKQKSHSKSSCLDTSGKTSTSSSSDLDNNDAKLKILNV